MRNAQEKMGYTESELRKLSRLEELTDDLNQLSKEVFRVTCSVDGNECTEEVGAEKYSVLSHRNKEITQEGKHIKRCFKGQEESNGIIKRYDISAKEVENYLYNLQETIEWRKSYGI